MESVNSARVQGASRVWGASQGLQGWAWAAGARIVLTLMPHHPQALKNNTYSSSS